MTKTNKMIKKASVKPGIVQVSDDNFINVGRTVFEVLSKENVSLTARLDAENNT